jgi:hypothetical protein
MCLQDILLNLLSAGTILLLTFILFFTINFIVIPKMMHKHFLPQDYFRMCFASAYGQNAPEIKLSLRSSTRHETCREKEVKRHPLLTLGPEENGKQQHDPLTLFTPGKGPI